jgi:hypothetical protein
LFGEAPRRFDRATEQRLLVNPPWFTKLRFGDSLARLVQNGTLRALFRQGDIVWGHVIQANTELYEPPPSEESYTFDRPGELVFSPRVDSAETPLHLGEVARHLAGLRDASDLDAELQPWSDYLFAETERVVGRRVPSRFAAQNACFVSTTLFRRSHLPGGLLEKPLLPIVVARRQPYFAMTLPREFWPPALLEWWRGKVN